MHIRQQQNSEQLDAMNGAPFDGAPGREHPRGKSQYLPIHGLSPFTMLDFPDHTACIVWMAGCNMRCGYCHNPDLVMGKGQLNVEDVMAFLRKRQGLLDGVVFTGGEASIWPGLPGMMRLVKNMGFAVKLDTNGTRPECVAEFLEHGLVDYVALDYKAPPEKFRAVTGIDKFALFARSLDMLCNRSDIALEVRTTVHTALMGEKDINAIIADLDARGYSGTYYIQNFRADNARPTLGGLWEQPRLLQTDELLQPRNFGIDYRNF